MAWHPLSMHAIWFTEIEPFPSAVLAHHHPNTPNFATKMAMAESLAHSAAEKLARECRRRKSGHPFDA